MTNESIKQVLFDDPNHPTPHQTWDKTYYDLAVAYRNCGSLTRERLNGWRDDLESLKSRPAIVSQFDSFLAA